MTNESSSMTMKSDNESKLVNTTISNNIVNNNNNNNIYYTACSSSNNNSNKSTSSTTTLTVAATATTSAVSDLPSITLAPFAKIKRESDFISTSSSDYNNKTTNNTTRPSSMVMKSINNNNNHNSQVPIVNNNTVSAKMGSRRIFTPQFKLQVLESYRNDADCKGNQRATARKYNIHRRQIQKWLQCESNLRSSVANISANNVKHQFHNITHHQMPIVTNSTLPLQSSSSAAASASSSSSIHTNNNQHHLHAHHNQQQYKAINNRLSLDTTRHSVALTSIQIPTSKGVLAAAAAANNVGDVVGAVAPLSSSSPSSTAFLSTSTVKSLRAPTSPILHSQILTKSSSSSLNTNTNSTGRGCLTVSPSKGGQSTGVPLHAYHHHDSMGIHTPPASLSSVPVSVPIITPHPHTHLHVTNLKIHHYQHLHMEQQNYLNLHHQYNQVLLPPPPQQQQQQQQQSNERRSFMPSASLPALPTSSSSSSSSSSFSTTTTTSYSPPSPSSTPMTAVALSCTDTLATTPTAGGRVAVSLPLSHVEENRIDDELRDYRTTSTENRYMNENEYAAAVAVQSRTPMLHRAYEGFHYLPMPLHMHPAAATMLAPIDLSLGTKRLDYTLASLNENNNVEHQHSSSLYTDSITKCEQPSSPKSEDEDSQLNVVDSDISESSSVVDLTLRKRKVQMPTSADITAEKHTKLNEKEAEKPTSEPAKTFKLFKPYLLDEDNNKSCEESSNKICKQKDPIIWSHHTACMSPPISVDSLQSSSRGSNFQSPPADTAYPFPAGSPTFQSTNAATSAGFRCPKGSPVSGYESSSSIYSDSASSNCGDISYNNNINNNNTTNNPPHHSAAATSYRFDLKVHDINGDLPHNHLISPTPKRPFINDECMPHLTHTTTPTIHINHVQRWLDQESGIRQSIALYV